MPLTKDTKPVESVRDIDPESKLFMEFVKENLATREAQFQIINEVLFKARIRLSQDPKVTMKHLQAKLIKGAHEHGAPIYDDYRLQREFEDECLDLIGWTLVERYNKLERVKALLREGVK